MSILPKEVDSLFSLEGWTDAKSQLKEEAGKLKPWTFVLHPELSEDMVLSAPEAFDPKTDIGCLENVSLKELISRNTIVPAAQLSAAEQVDLLDALLIYETMYMRSESINQTLFTCTYLHELSLVEGNKAIKAFCRAVLKFTGVTVSAAINADVRDGDEEFVPSTYDIDPLEDTTVESILKEVDEALADATVSDAIKSRLTLQRSLLAVIDGVAQVHQYKPTAPPKAVTELRKQKEEKEAAASAAAAASNKTEEEKTEEERNNKLQVYTKEELDQYRPKTDVAALVKAFATAVHAWHREKSIAAEPAVVPKVFSAYASRWMNLVAPQKAPKIVSLNDAKEFFKNFAGSLNTIVQWKKQNITNNWYVLLNAVKQFNLFNNDPKNAPNVIARSLAVLYLFNPSTGLVLDQKAFYDIVLHTLDAFHGAPVYSHVFYDHDSVVNAVIQARTEAIPAHVKATMKPAEAQRVFNDMKREFINETRRFFSDLGQMLMIVIHTLLRARGSCHKVFNQKYGGLAEIQGMSAQFDAAFFGDATRPPTDQDPKTRKHFVLAAFITELVCDIVELQFNNEIFLNLLTKQEVMGLQMYRHALMMIRQENFSALFVDQAQLPSAVVSAGAGAANKKNAKNLISSVGAAAAYRQAKPVPTHVQFAFEATRIVANLNFLSIAALATVIPGTSQPSTSLVTTEVVFENRFRALRGAFPNQFPNSANAIKQSAQVAGNPIVALENTVKLIDAFLAKSKAHLEATSGPTQALPFTKEFATVAKQNKIVLGSLKMLLAADGATSVDEGLADYNVDFETVPHYPQLLRFTMSKKQ